MSNSSQTVLKMKVKLTQQSIDFAIQEGTEIFKNSRSLTRFDTLRTKINNSLIGAFGQQVLIENTGGRRVSKEECPSFAYDVVCTNEAIHKCCGWSQPFPNSQEVRVEVKVRPVENRKWISFNDQMFRHVTRYSKSGDLDYVVFYGISNINLNAHEADIDFLGIISAKVLTIEGLRSPSHYEKGSSFLNKYGIHDRNLGRIVL